MSRSTLYSSRASKFARPAAALVVDQLNQMTNLSQPEIVRLMPVKQKVYL